MASDCTEASSESPATASVTRAGGHSAASSPLSKLRHGDAAELSDVTRLTMP
jgi:hypothetical protein